MFAAMSSPLLTLHPTYSCPVNVPTAPECVLTAHCIEIRGFDCFTSDILTPGEYVEEAKFRYDEGCGPDDCPPYMVIYDTIRRTCEEQRKIIEEATDRTVLSSVFKGLLHGGERPEVARVVPLLLPNDHENKILGTPYPSCLACHMD
jgi:hypothetical protein